MKLYRAYCYLFYQAYLWQDKYGYGSAELSAMVEIGTATSLYTMGFFTLLYIIFGWNFLISIDVNRLYLFIFLFIPLVVIRHVIFISKDKYKKILVYYEKNPPNKKYAPLIHWSYFFGSFIFFLFSAFLTYFTRIHNFTVIGYLQSHFFH